VLEWIFSKESAEAGINLSEYSLGPTIYFGSFRVVTKATHKKTGESLALKYVSPMLSSDRNGLHASLDSLYREALIGKGLDHPNVLKLYGLAEHQDVTYLVMELVSQRSLVNMIRDPSQFTLERLIRCALDICEGLSYLHLQGVVHRDIKPSNILFRGTTAKVTDLGLATFPKYRRTREVSPRSGTPKYMAPEQLRGEPTDPRSDIYSLGMVLYELLSGEVRITEAGLTYRAVESKQHVSFPPLHEANPRVPPDLSAIVMRCLQADPSKRFPTARSLAAELRPFLERVWVEHRK